MDLISWSLNAVDRMVSGRKSLPHETVCPTGTFNSGYVQDSWDKWRIVCLSHFDIEDVEDVYVFVGMLTGFAILGAMMYYGFRYIKRVVKGKDVERNAPASKSSAAETASQSHIVNMIEVMEANLISKMDLTRTKMEANLIKKMDQTTTKVEYKIEREATYLGDMFVKKMDELETKRVQPGDNEEE